MRPDEFTSAFRDARRKARVRSVRYHDLRHAYATELRRRGVPLEVVSKLMGHSSPAFTASVYVHVDADMAQQAVEAISAALSGGNG